MPVSNKSSKHSKSVTSSHSRPKSGKMVPKINPTTVSKIVNQSSTSNQNGSNMGIPNTISVQIEQKKKQAGIEIEEEMKKVQLELLEKRQERLVSGLHITDYPYTVYTMVPACFDPYGFWTTSATKLL